MDMFFHFVSIISPHQCLQNQVTVSMYNMYVFKHHILIHIVTVQTEILI
jgi:hypothetical protein